MHDFFDMGGYGGYVWGAYAVFFVVLAFDAVAASIWMSRLQQISGVSTTRA